MCGAILCRLMVLGWIRKQAEHFSKQYLVMVFGFSTSRYLPWLCSMMKYNLSAKLALSSRKYFWSVSNHNYREVNLYANSIMSTKGKFPGGRWEHYNR